MAQTLSFRLAQVHEGKCNFCFEWCETVQPHGNDLLCCQTCFQDFSLNGRTLQTTQGERFNLVFVQDQEEASNEVQAVRGQLESLMNYDVQETFMRWSRIQSLFDDNEFTNAEIETIEEKIQHFYRGYEEEKENLAEFIKNMNHSKSKSSYEGSTEENGNRSAYQSLVENKKENQMNNGNVEQPRKNPTKPVEKLHKLQDYCKNLGATRFVKRYQYYFDTSEIKRYKDVTSKPLKTRQFGCELFPNPHESSSQKESCRPLELQKVKSNRSFTIPTPCERSLKLSEEELKGKILSYLQPRSQSVTMTRIMATFVREAYLRTNLQPSSLELISFRISNMDLACYFSLFDLSCVHTLKLVNVGLTDQQLLTVLELTGSSVQRLVLTGNLLTENALSSFLRGMPRLRELYLGKNRMSKYRMKENIAELRSRLVLYL